VVIDDYSQDGTAELAEAAGAVVYARALDNFAAQRNFALTKVTAEWVFFLDADERFTPELADNVRGFVERGLRAGSVKRQNNAFGRRHRFGQLAPDRVTRLFPASYVRWEGLVHERPVSDLPVEPIGGYLLHYTYDGWPGYLDKFMKYVRLWADEEYNKGRKSSVLQGLAHGAAGFLKPFILKLGFLEGPLGWALCWYNGCYALTKHLLLHQKHVDAKRRDSGGPAGRG
jgi:glycosyltransferase involved in cell wall biosynthesis